MSTAIWEKFKTCQISNDDFGEWDKLLDVDDFPGRVILLKQTHPFHFSLLLRDYGWELFDKVIERGVFIRDYHNRFENGEKTVEVNNLHQIIKLLCHNTRSRELYMMAAEKLTKDILGGSIMDRSTGKMNDNYFSSESCLPFSLLLQLLESALIDLDDMDYYKKGRYTGLNFYPKECYHLFIFLLFCPNILQDYL